MNSDVLRILDANANRAREALRVLEDYARFNLNDPEISGALKLLRHELATAMESVLPEAILHRDSPQDVGRDIKTQSELARPDIASVMIAAGKRLGEALRSLEEFTKIGHHHASIRIEKIRYRFYDIEQQIARTLHTPKFHDVRLCVLITESYCKLPWRQAAEEAILGGADALQLREKELSSGELLCRAKDFVALCRRHGIISIINDRADIALLADSDGVHVGQSDLPAIEARKILRAEKIIGVSTHNLEQAQKAVRDGANYIGVGPVFPSATKPRDFLPGLAFAEAAAEQIPIPALAIAGITPENAGRVMATGISGIAVTASVIGCDNVRAAASQLAILCKNKSMEPTNGHAARS